MYRLISVTKKENKVERGYANFQEWYDAMEFINSVEHKMTGRILSPRSTERTFSNRDGSVQQSYRLIKIGGMA